MPPHFTMKQIMNFSNKTSCTPSGCTEWTGAVNNKGYGVFSINHKSVLAHRIAYELAYGEIPDGACVLHRCDNSLCVNPMHLFLGTKADNNLDMAKKGRSTIGTRNPSAKLTERDVIEIRESYEKGEQQKDIAKRYGTTQANVSQIVLRKVWRHI